MDESSRFIKLFACCIIVNGASRATVIDLQRADYMFLPLEIAELLGNNEHLDLNAKLNSYSNEDKSEIFKFFEHLVQSEYAFYTNEPALFPQISSQWKTPSQITNAVLDFDIYSDINITDVIYQLESLGCETIEIRCFEVLSIVSIKRILDTIENGLGVIRNIELLICDDSLVDKNMLRRLIDKYSRLTSITVHSSSVNETYDYGGRSKRLNYIKQNVGDESHCGFISPGYFRINNQLFFESQTFNNCLNRKIAIDSRGNIKNCPAMEKSFGHYKEVTLLEVIQDDTFTSKWLINKDNVEICQDCEFRYMCTDCRAFQNDTSDKHYKPIKCSYDPYSMTWSNEFFQD